jgi:hypothetical protein
MIAPSNIQTTAIAGGVRITWDDNSSDEHGFEVWRSDNGGAYALITTTDIGIETYDDTVGVGTYKYKVRAKSGETLSNYATKDAPAPLEFVFTSTGDGSGLGVFNVEVSENTVATIDGTGKFYTDLAGTEGESSTWNITTTGSGFAELLNRIYIKVPSGTATLRIKNVVTKWGREIGGGDLLNDGWDTSMVDPVAAANCPSVSIDVATMTYNTSINVFGLNTTYGDLTGNSIITYMEIADGTPNHTTPGHGGSTIGGDISLMPLTSFDCWDDTHFTGTCASATMSVIWCNGLNEVTFNVSAMPSLGTIIILAECSCTAIGDISICSDLAFAQILRPNTLTGSIAGLTSLSYYLVISGNITVPNVTNLTDLSYFSGNQVLTSANVNQILADIWANRDAAKTYTFRYFKLNVEGSGAPTGQGITDLANLRAYRSPNDDPTKDLWTIDTIV